MDLGTQGFVIYKSWIQDHGDQLVIIVLGKQEFSFTSHGLRNIGIGHLQTIYLETLGLVNYRSWI